MSAPRKPAVSHGQIPDSVQEPLRGLLEALVSRAHIEDGVGARSSFRDRKIDNYDLITLLLDIENRLRVLESASPIGRPAYTDFVKNQIG